MRLPNEDAEQPIMSFPNHNDVATVWVKPEARQLLGKFQDGILGRQPDHDEHRKAQQTGDHISHHHEYIRFLMRKTMPTDIWHLRS